MERPDLPPAHKIYLNFWEHPERQIFSALLIKTAPGASLRGEDLRRVVQSLGREYVNDIRALDAVRASSLIENSALALASSGFSMFALALAAMGLFGLMSCHVASRAAESGLRMALGAGHQEVRWLVVRQIVPVIAGGGVVGIAVALAIGRLMSGLVFGISTYDARLLAGAAAVLLLTAMLAAWIPTRRATSINPVRALRQE